MSLAAGKSAHEKLVHTYAHTTNVNILLLGCLCVHTFDIRTPINFGVMLVYFVDDVVSVIEFDKCYMA